MPCASPALSAGASLLALGQRTVRGRRAGAERGFGCENQKGAPHGVGEPDRDRPVQRKHARLHPGVAVVRGAKGRQRGRGRRGGHARGAQRCFHQAAPARQRVPRLRRVRSQQLVTEQTGRWRAPGVRVRPRQALALQRSTTRPRKSPSMRWCNSAHPPQAQAKEMHEKNAFHLASSSAHAEVFVHAPPPVHVIRLCSPHTHSPRATARRAWYRVAAARPTRAVRCA
jgi:hypothetical protein